MAKRLKQSTMDEFLESGGKRRKEHAEISQDVSDSGNSGNDELQTTNDSVENIDTRNEEDIDTSRITLKKEFSLYKLDNDRVKGLNAVDEGNDKALETCIIKQLEEDENLEVKNIQQKDCIPFKINWLYYKTEKTINIQASQIAIDREATNRQRLPGDRKTGNIIMYYRFWKHAPEVYLLCDGAAFNAILHLVDTDFRTNFAKCFLDEQGIKEIETINIAGPDIQAKTTFKMPTKKTLHTILYLDKVIISLTGILKKDCDLYEIIYGRVESEKIINLKIGTYTVRICEKMSYEMWAKIIQVISVKVSKPVPATDISIVHVLDFVRPVSDNKYQRIKLSSIMSNEAVDVLLEKKQSDDFYLSHQNARGFLLSSEFHLVLEKPGPRKKEVLRTWKSVPGLLDVINVIRKKIDSQNLEKDLNDRNIILKYRNQTWKMISGAVQDYIHGSVQVEDELFHKIGSKWYQLSTHFSRTVDRMFTDFSRNCTFQKEEEARMRDVFKYPWKHSDKQFEIEDVILVLGIGEEKAKLLVEILVDSRISITSDNDEMCFTQSSYLFPEKSELSMDFARATKNLSVGQESNSPSTTKEKKNIPSYVIWSCKQTRKPLEELPSTPMKKQRQICKKGNEKYEVVNPVLTQDLYSKISEKIPDLMEHEITNFLRSMMPLNENEYNQLYLHKTCKEIDIVFPGDRIQANNVELFDILLHDKEKKQTFLIHNKCGLGNTTRDACAQIRDSAELLWHDLMRGTKTHIGLFWDAGTDSTAAISPYREQLKEKLLSIGKKKYLGIFAKDVKFVFVFAFVTSTKTDHNLKFDLKAMSGKDFEIDGADGEGVLHELQDQKLVTRDGYLTDKLLGITNRKKFLIECKKLDIFEDKTQKRKETIYNILKEKGKCNIPTIAKIELLALDSAFAKYQIGGERKFELRILQLKSS